MAKADSVPTAVRAPITGASHKERSASRAIFRRPGEDRSDAGLVSRLRNCRPIARLVPLERSAHPASVPVQELQMRELGMNSMLSQGRRYFIGGSDARIIMGNDEAALLRLWREKRGEVEPEDLSLQSHRSAGPGDRGPEPALVRGQYRPGHYRYSEAGPASGTALDGGDA